MPSFDHVALNGVLFLSGVNRSPFSGSVVV